MDLVFGFTGLIILGVATYLLRAHSKERRRRLSEGAVIAGILLITLCFIVHVHINDEEPLPLLLALVVAIPIVTGVAYGSAIIRSKGNEQSTFD